MAQCLGLMNGIYASQKLKKRLKISYYPYSTGTYWPFAISLLLKEGEELDSNIQTKGLASTSKVGVGKVLTDHPLMTRRFSYEKLISKSPRASRAWYRIDGNRSGGLRSIRLSAGSSLVDDNADGGQGGDSG